MTPALARPRLDHIIDSLEGTRTVVVGDAMLDEYVFGTVSRISPEAPVPVVDVDASQHTWAPGGAANVARNLRALGAEVAFLGLVGDDSAGQTLRGCLQSIGVDVSGLLVDPQRPTTLKTRIIAHSQQVVRVDREQRRAFPSELARRLEALLESHLGAGARAVLLSDYDKGAALGEMPGRVVGVCRSRGVWVTANPKPANLDRLRGASLVTLNHLEAEAAVGRRLPDGESLAKAATQLREALELDAVLITRGSKGMALATPDGRVHHIPAVPVEVYDVVGAGDTAFGALTLALAAGANYKEAAVLANLAGGAVVRKMGTAVVTREELRAMAEGQF